MEELDPNKFHVLNPMQKKILIFIALFVVVVVLPLSLSFYYNWALRRPAQGFKDAQFEIISGESITSIADRLYEDELVNSAFLFKAYLITQNLHTNIQAGTYNIPAGASVLDLANLFQHGTNDMTITFPEGLRSEEYALLASTKFKRVDYNEFLRLSKEKEGYLFPDTYYFNADVDEDEMVKALLDNFEVKTAQTFKTFQSKEGLTKEEVVILASIIEREVQRDEDRKIVAGILIKRLRNGEMLGADATTQYAVARNRVCFQDVELVCPTYEQAKIFNWWPHDLTISELNFDSPYNTRKNIGLPPAPISNPGISAIQAVFDSIDTTYYYYLNDSAGNTHYASTLEEHENNISKYLQ